ncbi:MAG: LysE family translocator [Saccharospirillum sp.]
MWPFILVYTAAVISPGPDFALVVRSALTRGRQASLLNALGIGCGVGLHTLIALLGVSVLVQASPVLAAGLPLVGIAYLLYLGWGGLRAQPDQHMAELTPNQADRGDFWRGFLTNVLNPKALLFFSAILLQLVNGFSLAAQAFILLYVLMVTTAWFALVGTVLASDRLRQRFLHQRHWIDRSAGVIFVLLAALFLLDWWQRFVA